ncbi:hypothetical protein G3480_03515 [Thiorhodococcus mannitoliphagus]|uniref:Uncharacterized protein n=1 Tax=Thiorhodococcus mannitoliphagus TaxID=329406 RepID=A0A6P1DR28_9GAMM|nr:hypothetical protein [Thiorhodococcus mannitoliphagus]NEX19391.1 hypothetical protein [Thiorhodococcus mannitoliphagus]
MPPTLLAMRRWRLARKRIQIDDAQDSGIGRPRLIDELMAAKAKGATIQ